MTVRYRFPVATVAVMVTMMIGGPCRSAAAQDHPTAVRRVVSSDATITSLIEQASTHSPAFTRLLATIEASNGIVHVQSGVCPGRVRACLPFWMASIGPNRFMRIVVDRRQFDSDSQLIGVIGHELQHAIEVLSDRLVTNSLKMYFFYRRHAPTERDRFETQEAIKAGIVVDREFRAWRKESASGDDQTVPNRSTARLLATLVTKAN